MRLEYEKHTVKTNWFAHVMFGVLGIVMGIAIITVMTGMGWLITYTITQWGKG